MAPGAMKAEALEAIPSVTRKAKGSRKGQAKDVGGEPERDSGRGSEKAMVNQASGCTAVAN
jgi:hypothetical protein